MTGSIFWAMSLYLPVVAGQNIFNSEKAKSLRRDPEKGVFYAHFKSHQHRRLDISPIKRTAFRNRQECAQECTNTKSCFSFNLASKTDLHDKLTCELLPSDLYAELDRFGDDANFNHFSIKVDVYFCLFLVSASFFLQYLTLAIIWRLWNARHLKLPPPLPKKQQQKNCWDVALRPVLKCTTFSNM